MRVFLKSFYGCQLLALLSISMNTIAAPLTLSNAPLPVSTVVSPNVMLLLDNSGSMNNIVWDAGYDSGITYPDWSVDWDSTNTNVYYSNLNSSGCASGYRRGKNASGTLRCLFIPHPEGNNTRYNGNYLNYLFETYGENGKNIDLSSILDSDYQITRMATVKTVAKLVTTDSAGIKFGLAKLGRWDGSTLVDYKKGGTIAKACVAGQNLNSDIDGLGPDTWTPLSEALYEVTRYFRGIGPYSSVSFPGGSPIEYRCQKNFTIVLTDGLPTYDTTFPTNDPDVPAGRTLQNWDNDATNDGSGGSESAEGSSLYLDDIAKFAWDTDFRKSGNDAAGVSFNDAAFPVQNMYTYTVGFAVDNSMLQEAAEKTGYGHGVYYTATDATGLTKALRDALADITKKSGSSSSAAASTGRIQTGSSVYQARYDSSNWSGEFLAFALDTTIGSVNYGAVLTDGPASNGALFDAGKQIPAWDSRVIVTNKTGGVAFDWAQFTAAEQTSYFDGQKAMWQYLRGRNSSDATYDVSVYRNRQTNLGDVVHSTPYFVGTPAARYSDSFESVAYSSFVTAHKNRDQLLYVGANDGMLHAFDAPTGVEKIAFIPGSLLPKLKALSDPDYSHQYYVDGSPTVVDAFKTSGASGAWKTVLVGGLNKGGQGVYALDITDPSSFTQANAASLFMWEFRDQDDVDLGYSFSRPKIVKLQNGKWYAVFGNGYNNTDTNSGLDSRVSTTGNAVIYIVDLWDKTNVIKLSTGVGMSGDPTNSSRPNGFSTLTPVDLNGDQVVDYIYGGDLFGNVWKFNLNDADSTKWKLDYKLYSACSADPCVKTTASSVSNAQPITTAVTVGKSKSGIGQMIYFGTGQYIEVTDNNGALGGRQTFYGIHDTGANVTGRSKLLQQTITIEASVNVNNTQGTLTTSDDVIESIPLRETSNNYATNSQQGWYLDLVPPAGERGERLISTPAIRGKRLLFVTNIPADDPCSPGGDSWLMSLDAFTGGRLNQTYDLDKNGKFGTADKVFTDPAGNPIVATGIKVGSGGNSPSFMPGSDSDQVIISGNDQLETMRIDEGDDVNRQSWQQITR